MDSLNPLRNCNLCGCDSNETAIFTCAYAKGELNICLQCLTEGILEITKDIHKSKNKNIQIKESEFPLEEFDINIPEQVFGFNCEDCGNIMFSNGFPAICDCGHENNEIVLQKQDLINRK